jgi:hypothetical protein
MVKQPVQQGGGDNGITEHFKPNFRTFILENVLNQQFVGHFRF